jgi:hypothetical protein
MQFVGTEQFWWVSDFFSLGESYSPANSAVEKLLAMPPRFVLIECTSTDISTVRIIWLGGSTKTMGTKKPTRTAVVVGDAFKASPKAKQIRKSVFDAGLRAH